MYRFEELDMFLNSEIANKNNPLIYGQNVLILYSETHQSEVPVVTCQFCYQHFNFQIQTEQ